MQLQYEFKTRLRVNYVLELRSASYMLITYQEFDVPILSFDIWIQCFILSVGSSLVRLNVSKCDQLDGWVIRIIFTVIHVFDTRVR